MEVLSMMKRRSLQVLFTVILHAVQLSAQDTLIVRADNSAVWGTAPKLVEELRIGLRQGDERYEFGLAVDLVELSNGDVWVADRMRGTVRRYSSTGAHLG